jgi:NADPH:quinone reductase-like Zn-dependent oxidoreductase
MELPVPSPGSDEVLIEVRTVAANRQDTYTMLASAGRGPRTFPHVLGIDPAGIVVRAGSDVGGLSVGDRVVVKPAIACGICAFCLAGEDDACRDARNVGIHIWGGMAEYVSVPAAAAFRIPDDLEFGDATAISHSFPVALTMLRGRASLEVGETVLVTSAAGAVGSATVQLVRLLGGRVIAAAGGQEHVERARELAGLEAGDVIDYQAVPSFSHEVRRRVPGGIDLYVETSGEPTVWAEALRTLARRARVAVCGAHGGGIVALDLAWLFRNRTTLIGCSGSTVAAFREVLELAGQGRLRPNIQERLPLDRAREAFQMLESRRSGGKMILEVGTPIRSRRRSAQR